MKTKTDDPLAEYKFMPCKGLIHKYPDRAIILVTLNCASYCLFCTRRRLTQKPHNYRLTPADLQQITTYIKQKPQITEIILSGGDPLYDLDTLTQVIYHIQTISQIKLLRLGTRLPIVKPTTINDDVINILNNIKHIPLYIMLHVEHPNELTTNVQHAIKKLQSASTMILSQSVFLKHINDDYATLSSLFTKLIEIGVKPYYLFSCDRVVGIEQFFVNRNKEIEIYRLLRRNLSGLACPTYVVDGPTHKHFPS